MKSPQDLVIVACHAPLRAELTEPPVDPEREDNWVLLPYQHGEVPFYLDHIRRGAVLAAHNPAALLVFSGSRSRPAAGRWSEAASYREVARRMGWWTSSARSDLRLELDRRSALEEYGLDSFENLLFSICRFQELSGTYPRHVTVVSWAFKSMRFEVHRRALRWPMNRFRFVGHGDPFDLQAAEESELSTLQAFLQDPHGRGPELTRKRKARNPFDQHHRYGECPGLGPFFAFLGTQNPAFTGRMPWETSYS